MRLCRIGTHALVAHLAALLVVGFAWVETANAAGSDSPRNAKPLAGATVAIDPGHNPGNARHADKVSRPVNAGTLFKACDTAGTSSRSGLSEARVNMRVATKLRKRLRRMGARVIMTRTASRPPWGPCITRRAKIGNRADVAVSIHADGVNNRRARGFHIIRPARVRGLTDDIAGSSKVLAVKLRQSMRRRTRLPFSTYTGRRGIDVRSDLGGLNLSDVPKVFVEMGNMKNRRDMRMLGTSRGQSRLAYAIADGLVAFHNKK